MSYRGDDAGHAGRIYDRLAAALDSATLFVELDAIKPGEDFVQNIQNAVTSCQVLIAIIGRDWLTIRDEDGNRRLDDPDDFVRLEMATALERDILGDPRPCRGRAEAS